MGSLKGKKAFITRTEQGIGETVVESLLRQNHRVFSAFQQER